MKISRHSKIIDLINQYDIDTQEELARRLKESGFKVTQATVSRDIRELKLMKITKTDGRARYAVMSSEDRQDGEKYIRVLKDAYLSMAMAQNVLIIKTASGMANAAAAALDHMNWPEIVGSLAGDDTIACFSKTTDETLVLMGKIRKVIHSDT